MPAKILPHKQLTRNTRKLKRLKKKQPPPKPQSDSELGLSSILVEQFKPQADFICSINADFINTVKSQTKK